MSTVTVAATVGIASIIAAVDRIAPFARRAALALLLPLLLGTLLGTLLPAAAQGVTADAEPATAGAPLATAAPAVAAPSAPIADADLLQALRRGGLVVYSRHTATDFTRDDSKMRDFDDCANQRLLSPKGRA